MHQFRLDPFEVEGLDQAEKFEQGPITQKSVDYTVIRLSRQSSYFSVYIASLLGKNPYKRIKELSLDLLRIEAEGARNHAGKRAWPASSTFGNGYFQRAWRYESDRQFSTLRSFGNIFE